MATIRIPIGRRFILDSAESDFMEATTMADGFTMADISPAEPSRADMRAAERTSAALAEATAAVAVANSEPGSGEKKCHENK
jgi:hypothetical protein